MNDALHHLPRRRFLGALAAVTPLVEDLAAGATASEQIADLSASLQPVREKGRLPSLAAVVIRNQRVVAQGAVGVRRAGGSTAVTINDKYHWGSLTKSMTASLAAMLVEEKKIRWTATLGEIFPEVRPQMHEDWRGVTLELLLYNRAGAPTNLDDGGLWGKLWGFQGVPREHRYFLLKELTAKPPAAKPGTKNIYSNAGYSLAGAMLERVMNRPWEELIQARLFKPLGMTSVGFGAPATPGKEDQPWGHKPDGDAFKPVPPGAFADNPAAISPAGRAHGSVLDLARYVQFHLAVGNSSPALLKPESFRKLHTPAPGQDYAMGWGVAQRGWAKGVTYSHSGSNTMFFAVIWIAPLRDAAFIAATNAGGDGAAKICDDTVGKFIREFLK